MTIYLLNIVRGNRDESMAVDLVDEDEVAVLRTLLKTYQDLNRYADWSLIEVPRDVIKTFPDAVRLAAEMGKDA